MYLPFIQKTIEQAGELARRYYGNVDHAVKTGDNNQVLTEADIAIGKYIVDAIVNEYPGHNVIDEEAGVIDNSSTVTWVVDPIDGTSNFAAGTPLYGCMIGVLENDRRWLEAWFCRRSTKFIWPKKVMAQHAMGGQSA